MNALKILLLLMITVLILGCGAPPQPSAPTSTTTTSTTSVSTSLMGTWVSDCRTDGTIPYKFELSFNQTLLVQTIRFYSDASCSTNHQVRPPMVRWTLYRAGDAVSGANSNALDLAEPLEGIPPHNIYQITNSTLQLGAIQTPEDGVLRRPSTVNSGLLFTKSA